MVWLRGTVSDQWRHAKGVWILKENNSTKLEQFRSISLLGVKGKIFFSVLAKRMTVFLLKNGYIGTSVQRGGIPGVVMQLIRRLAKERETLWCFGLTLPTHTAPFPTSSLRQLWITTKYLVR